MENRNILQVMLYRAGFTGHVVQGGFHRACCAGQVSQGMLCRAGFTGHVVEGRFHRACCAGQVSQEM